MKGRRHSLQKTEDLKKVIRVIDDQGNELEKTYIKRARGLVKANRACFISVNTIQLMCKSKNIILEENKMNNENIVNEECKMDINFIYKTISEIVEQGKTLHENMAKESIAIILSREETNRKLIGFLNDMLDRLYPQVDDFTINSNIITGLTESLNKAIENSDTEAQKSIIQALLEIQKKSVR